MGDQRYEGLEFPTSPLKDTDFFHTCVVVVSGVPGNLCGHALLHVGNSWYFHIAGKNNWPRFMNEGGYHRYLAEWGKKEIRRWHVPLSNPAGANAKLRQLMNKNWRWLILGTCQ